MRLPLLCTALLAAPALGLASPLGAQTSQLRTDFGATSQTTATVGWNDVHPGNVAGSHALAYEDGTASGIQLDFTPGKTSSSANSNGVVTPTPGSPLAGLGWPANALRDSLYGSSSLPEIEFALSGLDPSATYDFTIVGSRLGVSDVRTVTYTVSGANVGSAVLDVANNTTAFVSVRGIRPDAANTVRFALVAAPTNTNSSRFFYINALGIDEWAGGSQPPLVAFATNQVDVSRVAGKGPFALSLATYTNDGTAPALQLTAVDPATQGPPVWLSVPAGATAGSAIPLIVDGDAVGVGLAAATLTAQAGGYADATSAVVLVVRDSGGYLNLLFYGNSYSQGNGGVHTLVRALAEEAGFDPPNAVGALVGGQTLNFHLTNPGQAAAITQSLPLGEEWDFVVMQGFSLEATVGAGDPAQFLSDALAIYTNVRAHSPGARATLFQTWARGPGHSVYPGTFQDPLQMHQEIEANYCQAVLDIDAAFGPDSARRAAAGEAIALRNFDPDLYDPDLSHPGPLMSVMAADTIFTAIYGTRVCDLDVAPGSGTSLGGALAGFGMSGADWAETAGLAERAADAVNRRFPGSREDALLRSGRVGHLTACPRKRAEPGTQMTVRIESPIGTYDGAQAVIYANVFPSASPPGNLPGPPEIHYDPVSSFVLAATAALPSGGFSAQVPITPAMAGRTLRVQGYVQAPSAKTGNPFTMTDAHEIRVPGLPRAPAGFAPVAPPPPGGGEGRSSGRGPRSSPLRAGRVERRRQPNSAPRR